MTDAACRICGVKMTERTDCGGDCVWCLADTGDPECVKYVAQHPRPRELSDITELVSFEEQQDGSMTVEPRVVTNDDVLRDEQGYPAFEGLEAIVRERAERPSAKVRFEELGDVGLR